MKSKIVNTKKILENDFMLEKTVAIFALFLLLMPNIIYAQVFPISSGYVNDFANILDSTDEQQLNSYLFGIEKETTAEVVVVTVESAEPLTPKEYATELFNKWSIGKGGNDNG